MTLIASVLHLDRKAVKALRITDPYSLHRVVYSLYDDVRSDTEKSGSCPSGIQYADMGGDFHGRKILLLANRVPSEQAESGDGKCYGEVQSKEIPESFLAHDRYRFKVIVNPTRRNNTSRKLLPVKGREDIASWFCARTLSSWGFEVSQKNLQIDTIEVQRFTDKNSRQITLARAHLQGELRVVDRETFRRSFHQGIGRGRTFGCGLLQLVPVSDSLFD